MEQTAFPPTHGSELRALRLDAGVSQDEVAAHVPTTRQALRRWERHPRLSFVKAEQYRTALAAAVAERTGR